MSSSNPHHPIRPSWEAHRQEIERLYIDEGRSQKDVMDIMRTNHMLFATKFQWEAQLRKWGLRKNMTGDGWKEMDRYLSYHNIDPSQVKVLLRGQLVPVRKVKKELNRYRNTQSYRQVSHTLQHVPDQAPSLPDGFALLSRTPIPQILVRPIALTPVLMYMSITNFDLQLAAQPRSMNDFYRLLQSQRTGSLHQQCGSTKSLPVDIRDVPEMVVSIHVEHILPKIRSNLPILLHSQLPLMDHDPEHINASSITRHMNVAYVHLLLYALSNNMVDILDIDGYSGAWLYLKSHINAEDPLRLMQLLRAAKGKVLAWQLLRCAIEADDRLGVRQLLGLKELDIALEDVLYKASTVAGTALLNAVEYAAYFGNYHALEGLISAGASVNISGPEAQKRLQSKIGGPLYWALMRGWNFRDPPAPIQRVSRYLRRSGATVPACFLRMWFKNPGPLGPLQHIFSCWNKDPELFLLDTREYYISWLQEGAVHRLFEECAEQTLSDETSSNKWTITTWQRMWLLLQVVVTECEENGTHADIHAPCGTNGLLDIAAMMEDPGIYYYLKSCGYTSKRGEQREPRKMFTDYWLQRVRGFEGNHFHNGNMTSEDAMVSEVDPASERSLISEAGTISGEYIPSQKDTVSGSDVTSARTSMSKDDTMAEDGRPTEDHGYPMSRESHLPDDEKTKAPTETDDQGICWHQRVLALVTKRDEASALQELERDIDLDPMFCVCDRSCFAGSRPRPKTSTPWYLDLILSSIHGRLDKVTKFILRRCLYEFRDAVIILRSALAHEDEFTVEYVVFGGLNPKDDWAMEDYSSDRLEELKVPGIIEVEVLKAVVSSGAHFPQGLGCKVPPDAPAEALQLIMDNSISIFSSCFLSALPPACSISGLMSQTLSRPRPQPTPRQNALLLADALLHATKAANISLAETICQSNVDIHTFEPLTRDRKRHIWWTTCVRSNHRSPFSTLRCEEFTGTLLGAILLTDTTHNSTISCLVLHRCCQKGKVDRMAVKIRPTVYKHFRLPTSYVCTPLLVAIGLSKLYLAQRLVIDFKADVNFPPDRGIPRTPLQLACEYGDLPIVEFLIEQGADINGPIAVSGGGTALQLAAIGGFCGIMELLISRGADVDAPGARYFGRTALEGAAEHGRLDAVSVLFRSGVKTDGEHRSHFDKAVEYAMKEGHIPLAEFMKDWDARNTETERMQ